MNQSRATSLPLRDYQWESPPAIPALSKDDVHVWKARLNEANVVVLERFLSDEERARAGRFRFQGQRKDFIAARGLLRIILGRYLNAHPGQLGFEYSRFGKPSVRGPSRDKIRFNVSHSDGFALYAVACNREIGIDLERVKPFSLDERTVSGCLTAAEIRIFQSLPSNQRKRFFFECWTRKESYLKARGVGLMSPPNQIECTALGPCASLWIIEDHTAEKQAEWSFRSPPPIPAFAAALVVEGSGAIFNYWTFGVFK